MVLSLSKSQGISQIYKDSTTTIPNTQLRKAINTIEKGKVVEEELKDTKELVRFLNHRIEIKDSIILKYATKDIYWRNIDSNNKILITNYKKVIDNTNKMYDIQTKNFKKQKRLGLVKFGLGVLVGLLYIK